jgi:hypothetical protein
MRPCRTTAISLSKLSSSYGPPVAVHHCFSTPVVSTPRRRTALPQLVRKVARRCSVHVVVTINRAAATSVDRRLRSTLTRTATGGGCDCTPSDSTSGCRRRPREHGLRCWHALGPVLGPLKRPLCRLATFVADVRHLVEIRRKNDRRYLQQPHARLADGTVGCSQWKVRAHFR